MLSQVAEAVRCLDEVSSGRRQMAKWVRFLVSVSHRTLADHLHGATVAVRALSWMHSNSSQSVLVTDMRHPPISSKWLRLARGSSTLFNSVAHGDRLERVDGLRNDWVCALSADGGRANTISQLQTAARGGHRENMVTEKATTGGKT